MLKYILLFVPFFLFADSSLKIKSYGKTRVLNIKIEQNKTRSLDKTEKHYTTSQGNSFDDKSLILVKLKDNTNISEFETKFDIKLKKKMKTGYYLFENKSQKDIIDLINTISDDKNTITVKPNWRFGIKTL